MSGSNVSTAVVSTVSVSNGQESTISMDVATAVSSPAVTGSLNTEIDAEMQPGYDRGSFRTSVMGTGPSSLSTGLTQSLVTLATTAVTLPISQSESLNTSSLVFTPASGSQLNLTTRPLSGQLPSSIRR
ncbi:hypothetical protein Hanom_Chr11g00985471 [Helianthus anomalus]